jgi:integrase
MAVSTRNQYLARLAAFIRWAMTRRRIQEDPLIGIRPLPIAGQASRPRRAAEEEELGKLLSAVAPQHQLAYWLALSTGLRRNELRQLRWSDVHLEAPHPYLDVRAESTKSRRQKDQPLHPHVVKLLRDLRRATGGFDSMLLCRVPHIRTHWRYLASAGIAAADGAGRRLDFHALRHTFGTLVDRISNSPHVTMDLMRHTDPKLTMNVYSHLRLYDLAGVVEQLPLPTEALPQPKPQQAAIR